MAEAFLRTGLVEHVGTDITEALTGAMKKVRDRFDDLLDGEPVSPRVLWKGTDIYQKARLSNDLNVTKSCTETYENQSAYTRIDR